VEGKVGKFHGKKGKKKGKKGRKEGKKGSEILAGLIPCHAIP
jgi:hypothetical protein